MPYNFQYLSYNYPVLDWELLYFYYNSKKMPIFQVLIIYLLNIHIPNWITLYYF